MTDKRKRSEFPKSVKLAAWTRSKGKCEECGKKLFPGKFQYDHTVPDAMGGEPTLENCKVLCSGERDSCNSIKTYGSKSIKLGADIFEIAKTKRLKKKHSGPRASKHNWPSRPMSNSRFKKKLDGSVELRGRDG